MRSVVIGALTFVAACGDLAGADTFTFKRIGVIRSDGTVRALPSPQDLRRDCVQHPLPGETWVVEVSCQGRSGECLSWVFIGPGTDPGAPERASMIIRDCAGNTARQELATLEGVGVYWGHCTAGGSQGVSVEGDGNTTAAQFVVHGVDPGPDRIAYLHEGQPPAAGTNPHHLVMRSMGGAAAGPRSLVAALGATTVPDDGRLDGPDETIDAAERDALLELVRHGLETQLTDASGNVINETLKQKYHIPLPSDFHTNPSPPSATPR